MNKKIISILISLGLLSSFGANAANVYGETKNKVKSEINTALKENDLTLDDILSSSIKKKSTPQVSKAKSLRLNKIKQVAFEYGVHVGRAEQTKMYAKKLEMMSAQLDRDYDFNRVLIHHNPPILPPVISEGFDNFKSLDPSKVMVSKHMMKIEIPAQIVSVVPTWRDYLKMDYTVDQHPREGFKPKDKIESQIWDEAVKEGYIQGKSIADLDADNAIGQLKRDYTGMLNYKIALANGHINPAIVEISDLKNIVDENGTVLRRDEIMVQIAQQAYFSKNKVDANTKRNPNPAVKKLPNGQKLR